MEGEGEGKKGFRAFDLFYHLPLLRAFAIIPFLWPGILYLEEKIILEHQVYLGSSTVK